MVYLKIVHYTFENPDPRFSVYRGYRRAKPQQLSNSGFGLRISQVREPAPSGRTILVELQSRNQNSLY